MVAWRDEISTHHSADCPQLLPAFPIAGILSDRFMDRSVFVHQKYDPLRMSRVLMIGARSTPNAPSITIPRCHAYQSLS